MRLKKLCALLLAVVLTLGLCSCSIGKKGKYEKAVEAVRNGRYQEAIESLEALDGYEDSAKYIIYARALQAGDSGDYENAIKVLEALNGFEKSAVYITSYTTLAYEAEQARMKNVYNQAIADVKAGNYDAAIAAFETLNDYEDSGKYIAYARALQAGDSGDYETAIKALEALNGFEKSAVYITSYTTLAYEAEQARMKNVYNQAIADVKSGNYDAAIAAFETLNDYEDSGKYIMYARCLKTGDSGDYNAAVKSLKTLGDFKDATMYIQYYTALGFEAEQKYEEATKVYEGILLFKDVQARVAALPDKILDLDLAEANTVFGKGGWRSASKLKGMLDKKYSDSDTRMYENVMAYALQWREQKRYDTAIAMYELLLEKGYENASEALKEAAYEYAKTSMDSGDYAKAEKLIKERLSNYKDASDLLIECRYQQALKAEAKGADSAQAAYDAFKALGAYKDSADHVAAYESKYAEAVSKSEAGEFDAAIALFKELGTYSDSSAQLKKAQTAKAYAAAVSLMNDEKYEEAIEAFKALNGYKDSEAQITECSYLKAEALRQNGKYDEAYAIYRTILEYKNVTDLLKTDRNLLMVKFRAGNYITFGNYPQTEAGDDNTPIEWLVLECDGESALLISRYALDSKSYGNVIWEKCALRTWLNKQFYNRAFSVDEKRYIIKSDLNADKNPRYNTSSGDATKDNVFLLSIVEVNKYFTSDDTRKCAPTDYAIQQGALVVERVKVEGRRTGWWWLRSPGRDEYYVAYVDCDGAIDYDGIAVFYSTAVRPCVRVRLF